MAVAAFPALGPAPQAPQGRDLTQWAVEVSRWLQGVPTAHGGVLAGKTNNTVDITLVASSATTTITDQRITATSYIGFMPLSANALNAWTTLRVSAQTNGSATLTHALDTVTDKDFRVLIVG